MKPTLSLNDTRIAVIGLGYVGLPLAVEFAKKFPVTGFDINTGRISELNAGHDNTLEVEDENLASVIKGEMRNVKCEIGLCITDSPEALKACNVFIVTVPTPVDRNNRPDLTPLIKASETVGRAISTGAGVIY